ncbi:MAG: hypothetical protein Q7T86_03335 [Hyphomicrobiaceae bacterium]|nr:hypothetical protein [Hyphomicrobiaceae bacterium]
MPSVDVSSEDLVQATVEPSAVVLDLIERIEGCVDTDGECGFTTSRKDTSALHTLLSERNRMREALEKIEDITKDEEHSEFYHRQDLPRFRVLAIARQALGTET